MFEPLTFSEENIDKMIQQLNICENYCKTTRMYLEMTKNNLEMWNNMFILKKDKE